MTNLYLAIDNENINSCPKPKQSCEAVSYAIEGASHLRSIFNDDPKKCFENAIKKEAFTNERITQEDYIMYMCSNNKYDFFKSKITKTKWKVLR